MVNIKKFFINSLMLMIGLNISAQSFVNEIDLGQEEEITDVIVLPTTKEYVASLAIGDSLDEHHPIYLNSTFLLLDSVGKIKKVTSLSNFYPIELIQRINSFLAYGYFSENGMHEGMAVYSFDYQLNILDSIKITSYSPILAVQIDVNSRGEIIIPMTNIDTIKNIYVSFFLKIDSNFQILDTIVYDTVSFGVVAGILNSKDDFVVYQEKVNYRQMSKDFRNFVFLVDSTGKKIKQGSSIMPVFNPMVDSLMIDNYVSLKELPNQNIVLSGKIVNPHTYIPMATDYKNDYGVIVYDTNMNYINHNVIGLVDTADFPATRNITYDSKYFYIAGVSEWAPSDYYQSINNMIRINQFDFQGNLINTRNYFIGDYVKINSIKTTVDNGLVLVGSNYNQYGNSGGLNGFIVKIDSLGNLYTSIAKNKNNLLLTSNYYKVYPNPAKDNLNLLKINQFKPYEFELYDTFGRLVKTVNWSESHQQINVADLASGIYVYRITDEEGRKGSGKVMVE